jgi:tRNA pseudouridine32 synthase/23S rRNA pseudouridine746 synthase
MVMPSRDFTLLAEEPGFLVLDKGPGLDFHDRDGCPGLCSRVRDLLGTPLFPVHRLDKPTSGLVLMARTREWAAILAGLFRDRAVGKYYLALSDQAPRKKQGLVAGDMVRSRRGGWKLTRSMERPARTRFVSRSVAPGLRLFVLKPLTGRTHQLRVAMKSLGAPILGDGLYHPRVQDWPDRMYLHAHTLRFVLDGQIHVYRCPPRDGHLFLDKQVEEALAKLGPLEDLVWPGGGNGQTPG